MGRAGNRIDLSSRLEEWRRLLLDTSKRSRLVSSKFGRGGILAVEHPDFYQLWERLAVNGQPIVFPWPSKWTEPDQVDEGATEGDVERHNPKGVLSATQIESIKQSAALRFGDALTNLMDRPLDGRLKRLSIVASTSLSEQGVNSLFMAFGFLKWFESAESDLPILSPLVLLPVSLRKESADSCWELAPIDDDLASNHPLAELLRSEFRINIPQFAEDELWESGEALRSYFAQVEGAITGHDRWQIQLTAGLGTFGFQKISMWQDLLKNEGQITSHPICRGIAGDSSQMPTSDASDLFNTDLDKTVSPETSYLVRDCDSSQLAAMEVVQKGHHLILDGPPGTGKSQTITNIISRCLASNKTVLFVSEKAAALEVVKRRLDEANLGDFCLECHSHKANKRAVVEELGRCLNRETETYPSQDHKIIELRRTRQKLNEYVRALHVKRSALELTAYAVHGRLARIRTSSSTRVAIPDPHSIDRNQFQEMEEAVARLGSCKAIIAAKAIHPWRGCRTELYSLTMVDDIRFHFGRAATRLTTRFEAARPLEKLGFLGPNSTLDDLAATVEVGLALLSWPRIPAKWVGAGLRQTAERYIALHDLSQNHRIFSSSVSAYCFDAYARADPSVAKAVVANCDKLRVTIPALPLSVRQQIAYLESVYKALQTVIDIAARLENTVNLLQASLGVTGTPASTSVDAANLATHAVAIAGLGRTDAQWLHPAERKRLRQIAIDAKQVASMANSARLAFGSKLLPSAFAAIATEQINDVLRHESWFARFGGSWRRAKQGFQLLYSAQTAPKSREVLDDAFQLKLYHQYVTQLSAIAGPSREALQWDGTSSFDWDSIIERLTTIDQLPETLQDSGLVHSALTSQDSTARRTIDSAARGAQEILKKFSSAVSEVSETAKNLEIFGIANFGELPIEALRTRANELQNLCREQLAGLKEISPLIDGEQDVGVNGVANDIDVLVELRNIIHQAEEVVSFLGDVLPHKSARSLGDWKEQSDLAKWVLNFLEQHDGAPPEHLLRAISDDAVKNALSDAIKGIQSTDEPGLRDSLAFLKSLFSEVEEVSTGITLNHAPLPELIEWLTMRARDADRIGEWVSYTNSCENLRRLSLQSLRDEILDGRVKADEAVDVLRQRFYRLWLDEVYRREPALGEFDAGQHDQTAERFREVDRFWVRNGFTQVRSRVLMNTARVTGSEEQAPDNSELGILLREVHKRKRHLPLRRLFASMPTLLLKLKPCVMMSPLAVSTYLGNSEIRFDVVIFDEASQVRPHDAVCAIYRASQLVVAGDQKQLPPTNFFERLGNDDDEDDDELEHSSDDYESILDLCATLRLPRQRLKWHYRSKREALIAFSNRHFYEGELVTFPSVLDVDGSSGVSFCFVENGRWAGRGAGGLNQAEAERIADMVMRHAAEQPDKSLGVITMNQAQQMRVLELIEGRRRASLYLEQFFSNDKPDPFFVKNLENVQGDERDVIFLGVGYAKNDAGTLSHNFGPLNRRRRAATECCHYPSA